MKILPYAIAMMKMSAEDFPEYLGGIGVENTAVAKAGRMREARRFFCRKTGQDYRYDIVAWHDCLTHCDKNAFDPVFFPEYNEVTVSDRYLVGCNEENASKMLAHYQQIANNPERQQVVILAMRADENDRKN